LSNIELFKRINLKQVADLFVECTAWSKELFTKLEEKKMRLRITSGLAIVALLLVTVTACSAVARHHEQLASHLVAVADTDDPISGEWNVSFFVHDQTTPATFNLKLEGNKITGTAFSEHTGPGTIRDGSWDKGKLNFTLDFKNHQSIVITGSLQEAKLVGEFTTEGFTANWEAQRK